jgi:hypothetical protein
MQSLVVQMGRFLMAGHVVCAKGVIGAVQSRQFRRRNPNGLKECPGNDREAKHAGKQ